MNTANLQQWVEHPELLGRETLYELRNLLAKYPYFQTLRLLYLKNLYLLHNSSFGAELRKSVLYVSDRRKLFYLIEGERFSMPAMTSDEAALEEEPSVDRTLALIDAFLKTMPEILSGTEVLMPDIATDYTAYLLRQEDDKGVQSPEAPVLRGHELVEEFIGKSATEASEAANDLDEKPGEEAFLMRTETGEEDENCFTETLAKIYIKQQRYDKALEIIRKLSLKNPKKNIYFADQIQFLEKLIINANSK